MPNAKCCPNCLSANITIQDSHIDCKQCGLFGDLRAMRFCKEVPVFNVVQEENLHTIKGQLYKHKDIWYALEGYVIGCGRPVNGNYCMFCRDFLPEPAEKRKKRGKLDMREGGKMAAAGE